MKPALEPWQTIAWNAEQQQVMYRDWGIFFKQNQQLDAADKYYSKSLDIHPDDYKSLLYRSKCKRSIAQTQGALDDAVAAATFNDHNETINLEICNALYELNHFEDCKMESHNNTRRFRGKKVAGFIDRLIVVDENFNDNIGDTLGPFILKNEKHFDAVRNEIQEEKYIETRPLWKIMKEQDKCDVLSILEKEEVILSPREIARRDRCFRVFHQLYFNDSWKDLLFLKDLRENEKMMLPQSKSSTPFLHQLAHNKYDVVKKFMKMLQARSPLYNERAHRMPNKEVWERHNEAHLNRVQYQTRRNMLTILRNVRKLRALGKLEKLSRYIEEVTGDYVILKTQRIMPWKFEFLHEIFSTLALAHADCLTIPTNIFACESADRMLILLRMHNDKASEVSGYSYVFGDKSTYHEPDAVDYTQIAYKKFLNRLEKRMLFAKYSIEKCYLLHTIASTHLKHNRLDECCAAARKGIEESKNSRNHMWQLLCIILICKCYAVLHKIERAKEAIEEASIIAKKLKCPRLIAFVDTCNIFNEEEIARKKRIASLESVRLRKSRGSFIGSRASSSSVNILNT